MTIFWPLSDSLTLGALPTAVASARVHARMVIGEWAMADMAETVTLIVSELITNAVMTSSDINGRPKYSNESGGLPVVHMRLRSERERIVIEPFSSAYATSRICNTWMALASPALQGQQRSLRRMC